MESVCCMCSIPLLRGQSVWRCKFAEGSRFSFYDHVHTTGFATGTEALELVVYWRVVTGMDIKQPVKCTVRALSSRLALDVL